MPTLGKFIQRRRAELGLTQEQLAERIGSGVRQAEISRLEHDRITLPRRQRLEQIAIALDVPLGTLLARSGWAEAEAEFESTVVLQNDAPIVEVQPEPPSGIRPHATPNSQFQAAIARAEAQILRSEQAVHHAQSAFESAQTVLKERRSVGRAES